jgi:hypothetical protein
MCCHIAQLSRVRKAQDSGTSRLIVWERITSALEVAVMYQGRIVATGSVDEVCYAPERACAQTLLAAVPTPTPDLPIPQHSLLRLAADSPTAAAPAPQLAAIAYNYDFTDLSAWPGPAVTKFSTYDSGLFSVRAARGPPVAWDYDCACGFFVVLGRAGRTVHTRIEAKALMAEGMGRREPF